MTELQGWGSTVEWDGEVLVVTGTNKAGKVALLGKEWRSGSVNVPRSSIVGLTLKKGIPIVSNGTLVVQTVEGRTYQAHFLNKRYPEFAGLVAELGITTPAAAMPRPTTSTTSDALGVEPTRRTSSKSGVFDGVVLNGREGIVSYKGQKYPLPAHATVETQGQLQSRVTVTRLLLTGPFAFALRKKRDNRELYLTVEGDGWAFVVDVDPNKGLKAREFAALVNSG